MTKLKTSLTDSEVSALLANYSDGTAISNYAKASVAACLRTGVVIGTSSGTILPTDYVTRAEVAVIGTKICRKLSLYGFCQKEKRHVVENLDITQPGAVF